MELALNLAWMVLATLMCWLWMRCAPREGTDRRIHFVAVVLIIAILFPVISITDDIAWAQNPAETDSCQRRQHLVARAHSTLHPVVPTFPPSLAEPCSDLSAIALLGNLLAPAVNVPALESIQNRPPPAA